MILHGSFVEITPQSTNTIPHTFIAGHEEYIVPEKNVEL